MNSMSSSCNPAFSAKDIPSPVKSQELDVVENSLPAPPVAIRTFLAHIFSTFPLFSFSAIMPSTLLDLWFIARSVT